MSDLEVNTRSPIGPDEPAPSAPPNTEPPCEEEDLNIDLKLKLHLKISVKKKKSGSSTS